MKTAYLSAAVACAALLVGCAQDAPSIADLSGAQACNAIKRLAQDAKRDAFGLDYGAAQRGFEQIIEIYNTRDDLDDCDAGFSKARAQTNLALVLSNQGYYRLADGVFGAARRDLGDRDDTSAVQDRAILALFRSQHSLNLNSATSAKDARDLTEETLVLLDQFKAQGSDALIDDELFAPDEEAIALRISEAQAYYTRGFANLRDAQAHGDNGQALIAQSEEENLRALDLVKTLESPGLEARFLIQTAYTLAEQERWAEALAPAQRARGQLAESLPTSPLYARALLVEGSILSFLDRTEEAGVAFGEALTIYRERPVGLRYEAIWPYVRFLRREVEQERMTPAQQAENMFNAGQLVRGSFTANDIAATAALFEAGEGAEAAAVRRWRDAERRLARLRGALSKIDQLLPEQEEELLRLITEAGEEAQELRLERDELAPNYAAALSAPVTITEIQEALGPDEALLQILIGDPESALILIEPESVEVHRVALDSSFTEQFVAVLRDSFRIRPDGTYPDFLPELSYALHDQLFRDLSERLRQKGHLFVSTSGALEAFPLELLVTQNPAALEADWRAGDYRGLSWFGDDVEISYLPAPRNLVDIRTRAGTSQAKLPLIAFGDYQSDASPETVLESSGLPEGCRSEAELVANLPELPRTAEEIARIAQAVGPGAEQVTSAAFTQKAVLERGQAGDLANFQVLHFATHGLLWTDTDCFAEPALTTSIGPGAASDGLLTSSEIRLMNLDAQAVVLSACDTAGEPGQIGISGENLSGLARAFFAGGTRSVVASQWQVNDAVGVDLMGLLYETVARQNVGFGAALKRAREQVRNERQRSHPAFWAPFVVIGDGEIGMVPAGERA